MLSIKRVSCLGILVILAGCSGLSYAMQNYSDTKPERFAYANEDWRIFHKPNENRLMITPSFKTAMAAGAKTGATFGLAGSQTDPENRFRTAALVFVKSKVDDSCKITKGSLVIDPQYEYFYEC